MSPSDATKEEKSFGFEVEVFSRLAAPFAVDDVKCKPGAISGNRALVLHYVDARVVMDRLDDVLGSWNWKTEYHQLPNGSVECRLSIKVKGEWVTKADVGGESEQPDEGDRTKSAYSDSLKRAAVQWGLGRYLYRLGQQWWEFDPQKRRFASKPPLPDWAIPRPAVLSDFQADELTKLLAEVGANAERFCKEYGISEVGHLPPSKYFEAYGRLCTFGRKKKPAVQTVLNTAPTTTNATQPVGAK